MNRNGALIPTAPCGDLEDTMLVAEADIQGQIL